MSSTAFALQILGEKRELDTEYGRRSFSILLFQDLAVIPVIALLPLFAPDARPESGPALAWSVAKAAGVFALVIVGGRYLVRPAFRIMAATRVREIVTAFSLFLVFGIAFLMHSIGLSMALGTFLAGALLAESEYRHELETNIAPFEGLLMGLFFIAVGMSVDFGLLLREPFVIFGLAFGLMLVKFTLLVVTGKLGGVAADSSRRMGALLCQGGEFAFVLFAAAAGSSLLDATTAAYLTAVVSISMAATPLVAAASDRFFSANASDATPVYDEIEPREVQVIIAGYGRVGQIISRILRSQNIPFTALEHSPEQVEVSRRFGNKIYYGDASRVDLLRAAGADRARVLALAIDDPEASVTVARVVREHFPNLKIFARVRNRSHAFELMDLKAELVTRETYGSSLEMAEKALEEFGVRKEQAARIIATFRKHDEATLAEQFRLRNDQKALVDYSKRSAEQLQQLLEADRES
jgi:glutathione-regulated potassium-efflux system ancillary protein KefC/glutathione-regulated potassium-efflux system protein KefB